MRYLTLTLVAIAFVVYAVVYSRHGFTEMFQFLPSSMTPFAVIGYLAVRWRSRGSQATFLIATLAYASLFVYLYVYATVLHPDPLGPLVALFVGVYAAPALAVLWWIAYAFEWHHRVDLEKR